MRKAWIAFFRGINVGGRHILTMESLKHLLHKLGAEDVKTYIQSGNAVFISPEENRSRLSTRISDAILDAHGFRPDVILLSGEELQRAVDANPFPTEHEKALHLYFLHTRPIDARTDQLEKLQSDGEEFQLIGQVLYLYAPKGIGRSKLASKIEKIMGVPVTARNWKTVKRMLDLLS